MLYKELGRTGKKISRVAFGCMRFLPEEYSAGNLDKSAELIFRARELGINYFDTAPGYCDDMSEKIVGHAFKQMKDRPYVSTKCGPWNAQTKDEARRMIDQSLSRLHVDKLTVYNMWCIKSAEEYAFFLKKGGVYEGILQAHNEGLIEHICCTAHIEGKGLADIVADGKAASVTLGYNALNFAYRSEGVQACAKAGVGAVVMNPLGGGLIPRHAERFAFLKDYYGGETVAQAAIRFLLGHDEITAALPGISTMAELEDVVKAAEGEIKKPDLAAHKALLNDKLNTLCTGCQYCDECPEDIPIPKLIESYNEVLLAGGDDLKPAFARLQDHWNIPKDKAIELAGKCIACGQCEGICTQKLPIIKRLAEYAG